MTDKLGMFLALANQSGDFPEIPANLYGRLDGKLRSTDASTALAALYMCWLSWDQRWSFYQFYLREFDLACTFIRLTRSQVTSIEEAQALFILWTIYSALNRLGLGDSLPFQAYRFARSLPDLLREWPAAESQAQREALEAQVIRAAEGLQRQY